MENEIQHVIQLSFGPLLTHINACTVSDVVKFAFKETNEFKLSKETT